MSGVDDPVILKARRTCGGLFVCAPQMGRVEHMEHCSGGKILPFVWREASALVLTL